MSQSINNFCPTVNGIATPTVAQKLGLLCSAMIGNALVVQGQPNPQGAPNLPRTLGLDASGLNGALSQLNGGTELAVPTSQASIVQTTQTSRQNGAIEKRLQELRDWTTGTAVAGVVTPRSGQVASLGTLEPVGQTLLAQTSLSHLATRLAVWEYSPTASVNSATET